MYLIHCTLSGSLDRVGLGHACTAQATSAAGGNETDLLSGGGEAGHRGRVANVLVVTTTVGVLAGVHGHTTHLRAGGERAVKVGFLLCRILRVPGGSHLSRAG